MIIVTGAKGQLGSDVLKILRQRGIACLGTDKDDTDITDKSKVEAFFEDKSLTAIIHCAAYTAVDKAEDEKEGCHRINVLGTKNLTQLCKKRNVPIIYVSTDYVFDGEGDTPFTTDSPKAPLNVYGQSKSDGEDIIIRELEKYFIVRTSWVFGEKNTNFIATMLRLAGEREELKVVADQVGSPTYSHDLAQLLVKMVQSDAYGIYHATNEGFCSWYDLAKKIFEIKGIDVKVTPVTSEEFPTPAKRPHNSRLDKSSLDSSGFGRLPHWTDAVRRYSENI